MISERFPREVGGAANNASVWQAFLIVESGSERLGSMILLAEHKACVNLG